MTPEELIGKLEQAMEPNRELDREIWLAIGGTFSPAMGRWVDKDGVHCHESWTRFTRSLDASLTLVPEGWKDDIALELMLGETGTAWQRDPKFRPCFASLATGDPNNPRTRHVEGRAFAPALALCIAALRAHLNATEGK